MNRIDTIKTILQTLKDAPESVQQLFRDALMVHSDNQWHNLVSNDLEGLIDDYIWYREDDLSNYGYVALTDALDEIWEHDIDELVTLIGNRCRHDTKARLRSILTYGPSTIPDYGIMRRLVKYNGTWTYIVGQSYPDEMRTVRDIILKGKA